MNPADSRIQTEAFGTETPRSWASRWIREGVLLLVLGAVALALQWASGAYRQEFGGHPDEAAHFVTALMIHDYLASAAGSHPMRFAERYYEHYPKVALGHWPPVFYVMQAGWMLIWGASRASVLALLAVLGALVARLVAGVVARSSGWAGGIGAGLLWLVLPYVQIHTGMVMADIPVTLFMVLSAVFLGRFLEQERTVDALGFGVWAGVAILTKGSAMALAVLVPCAVILSGRYSILRRPALWGSAVVVAVLAGPWTWHFRTVNEEGWSDGSLGEFLRQSVAFYPRVLWQQAGWVGVGLAVLGVWLGWTRRRPGLGADGVTVAVAALLPAVLLFQVLTPVGLEQRYLIPALPGVVVLAFLGLHRVMALVQRPQWEPVAVAGFLAVYGATVFRVSGEASGGFLPAARSFLAAEGQKRTPVLISSDASGEGQFIAAVASLEERPGHRIHRASKLLAESKWTGGGYRLKAGSGADLAKVLDDAGVRWVVLDVAAQSRALPAHRQVLATWMETLEGRLECRYRGPWRRRDQVVEDGVRLYGLRRGESWQGLLGVR